MANLVISGQTYNGVNKVRIPNTNAGQEEFIQPTGTKQITTNGTHNVSDYANAEVNVQGGGTTLQQKSATPTTSQQTIEPDSGYDGLSSVTIAAAPIQSSKTVTPGASQQTVQPDSGYLGLAQVIVKAASAAGLPIYTGTQTINNKNTQHAIKHNLNLNSYIGIYWMDNMASYMGNTSNSDAIMFGMAGYKVDLGLDSENGLNPGIGVVKYYRPSAGTWASIGGNTAASSENTLEMNYTYGIGYGTYNYIIIDLSNLSRGTST